MSSEACPMTPKAEFERQLQLLRQVRRVAIVGMSPNTERPSYEVGMYLRENGYEIVPVHPAAKSIADLTVSPSLTHAAQTGTIDLVDLFVAGERTLPIVQEAHALGIRKIWFQPGAENEEAEALARRLGCEVVSHACTMAVLKRAQS